MNNQLNSYSKFARSAAGIFLFLFLTAFPALAQDNRTLSRPQESGNDERAEQVLKQATEALGGSNYLNVRSIVGRGFYTPIKEGITGVPAKFVDYIVYPDRERTEFRAQGMRIIQTNTGTTGWIYDGGTRTIKDMTPEQVEDFHRGLRVSFDYLLRGFWRKDGARLVYLGRREAGLAKRNEAVRLIYPNDFMVEFEFGARDHLPAKAIYKRQRTNPDTEVTIEVQEEDRFGQFVTINNVGVPFVIDHFSAGAQTSRTNYEEIELNTAIPDTLFARPANVKAIK